MRKILVFGLFLLTTVAQACTFCICAYEMDVVVQNNTGAECRLVAQNVSVGNTRSTYVPLVIKAGEISRPYTIETDVSLWFFETAEISLSYMCGEDKMVSFKSKKEINKEILTAYTKMTGNIFSLSNMEADYNVYKQRCNESDPRPDTIVWTLH